MYVCESKQRIMVKSVDSEVNQLGFKSWFYHLITVCLNLLIYKMGIIILPTLWGIFIF